MDEQAEKRLKMTVRRLHYTFIKRHAHVRPVHGLPAESWQVNYQSVFEALVHDLTMFGPVAAVENFVVMVRQAWNSTNLR